MATRKHRRARTQRRKQRGGDGDGTEPVNNSFVGKIKRGIKGTVNSIKDWLRKPTTPDPTKPSSTKQSALLSPNSSKLPPATPPPQQASSSEQTAIQMPPPSKESQPSGMPPSGMPSSEMPPSGMPPSGMPSSEMPPSGMPSSGMPPSGMPSSGMPPSLIGATGGRRKKHRHTRKCKKINKKRK